MNWFEALTGFREDGYESTRERFEVSDGHLRSIVNGRRWRIGRLETPSLAELRARAAPLTPGLAGTLTVSCVAGDIRAMHRDPSLTGALVQVASQFNLLEMIGPEVTPEMGVARYAYDPTQGPACAIAAGAATIYRNYFVPIDGQTGQTSTRQIDCLRDLGHALGNTSGRLWTMRNGYALCTEAGLAAIDAKLRASAPTEVDALRDRLRIGVHWNVEATEAADPRPVLTQAFCSALPVSYTGLRSPHWRAFATLVLEGAYEATLWAAVINACNGGKATALLTQLGGGAFGNDHEWIEAAQTRALDRFRGVGLDVRLVARSEPSRWQRRVALRYALTHEPTRRVRRRCWSTHRHSAMSSTQSHFAATQVVGNRVFTGVFWFCFMRIFLARLQSRMTRPRWLELQSLLPRLARLTPRQPLLGALCLQIRSARLGRK